MMSESLESRKFERKQLFDVPLPVRSKNREAATEAGGEEPVPGNTMAFALLTKRGNRQQASQTLRGRLSTCANVLVDTNC